MSSSGNSGSVKLKVLGQEKILVGTSLAFCESLIRGDFVEAAKFLAPPQRDENAARVLRRKYLKMADGSKFDKCVVVTQMENWPGQNSDDLAWLYISLEGDQVEGIALTLGIFAGQTVVNSIEWGRP